MTRCVHLPQSVVARRKLQTPGTAKEHNKIPITVAPTLNPNDRESAKLTDQEPETPKEQPDHESWVKY